jgi:CBS-domain-containing membrane protein
LPRLGEIALAWLGAAIALGATLTLLELTGRSWLLASFGGSCVILFGMADSEMAQPRSFLGGHLVATLTGLAFLKFGQLQYGGPSELWVIAAVATALALMMATRTIHSPAGGNPIVVFAEAADWQFLIVPLAIGLAVLMLTALVFNNLPGRPRYPQRWK